MTIIIFFRLLLIAITLVRSATPTNHLAIKESPDNFSLPIAANTSDFKELVRKSNVFIDKTKILEKMFKMPYKVMVLSLPSAWGKSLTLDMIKTFVELQLDKDGNEILPLEETENYRLFKKGEIVQPGGKIDNLKSQLHISKAYSVITTYHGKWPVVYVKLSGINGSDYQRMIISITKKISEAFHHHDYLKKKMLFNISQSNITEGKRIEINANLKLFEKILDCRINANELTNSLAFLSELLYNYYDRRVFILMDDWDAIYTNIITQSNITEDESHRVIAVFSSFMINTFITNMYLEKGISTGTFRMLKLLPNMKPIKEFKTTVSPFYQLCSITKDEVDELFDYLRLNTTHEERDRIDEWYNGYKKSALSDFHCYNPRSIVHFANIKKIDNYRKLYHSNTRAILKGAFRNDDIRNMFENSLMIWENERFFYRVINNVYLLHFQKISKPGNKHLVTPFRHHLYSYLYDVGYLKIILRGFNDVHTELINEEVRNEMITIIMEYYIEKYRFPSASLENAVHHMAQLISNNDTSSKPLTDVLQSLICSSENHMIHFITQFISSQIILKYDYRSEKPENNVHVWSLKGNSILYNKQQGVIIASISYSYGGGTEDALEHAKKLREPLNKFKSLERIKFIGINISPDRQVHIHSEIQNFKP